MKAILLTLSILFPAEGHASRCFLSGALVSDQNSAKPTLSDALRVNFDADNRRKCEAMMESYCFYNVKSESYSPSRIKGLFRQSHNDKEEARYWFSSDCKLHKL